MRKQILDLIVPVLILTLTISTLAVLPTAGQDTDLIVDKLKELNNKLEGEKPALQNKVNAVIHQMEAGALDGALNKLQSDVKKSIIAWVEDPEELIGRVDEIIDLLREKLRRPKPDFEITTLPYRLDVIRGGFNTTIITITSLNDFNQEVTLSATTSVLGVTIALNPVVIPMHPDTTANSTLMVNATQTAALGDYIMKVTGTSGKLKCGCSYTTKHSIVIPLRIIESAPSPPPQKPDFTLTASPTTLVIEQGNSSTSIVTVASVHGFQKRVDLSVTSPPISGVNLTLYPKVVAPQPEVFAIAVLIFEIASSAIIDTYNITVTGTSDSLQRSAIVTLVVTAPPVPQTPDFTINAAPDTLTVEQGDTTSSTIIVTSLRGFDEMVELTFKPESISGVTLTLDPTRVVLSPASFETSRLKIEVALDAAPQELEITITGISDALERTATVSLNITLERRPPKIVSVSRMPETPAYNDTVSVSANIVDFESGIGDAALTYSKNGVQEVVTMKLSAGLYRATIPAHPFGTIIRYRIEASDKAGNSAASEKSAYEVVDPYQPTLGVPTWTPQDPIVNDNIVVNITVIEPEGASGIDQVILSYSNATAMFTIPMTDNRDGNWTAVIGNQTGAKVAFFVETADKAGNETESDIFEFNVAAPAFPLVWILAAIAILAAATGGGAYYVRRKRRKGEAATSVPSEAIKPPS